MQKQSADHLSRRNPLPEKIMSHTPSPTPTPEVYCDRVQTQLKIFYQQNPQIGESHGLPHVMAVHLHAVNAIDSHRNVQKESPHVHKISDTTAMEIRVAAMLHDVDDRKYFPSNEKDQSITEDLSNLPNAQQISKSAGIPQANIQNILKMITWVGCAENGNSIPPEILENKTYHLLIPRWSDRLEAVGSIGVVRCYQYNRETGAPLWKNDDLYDSPRPSCEKDVWTLATPQRFEEYLKGEIGGRKKNGSNTNDNSERSSMMSHYYDKLLHVARPPPGIVQNEYLEATARDASKELVEVCLRFGLTGAVDEEYILGLEKQLSN